MRSSFARARVRLALAWLLLALGAAAAPARAQIGGCTPNFTGKFVYVIETPLGDIPVELYPNMAPQTVANFQAYADSGDWDGSLVHRSVPGFVIQGGGYRQVGGNYATIPTDPPVANEPCLSNTTGTIAMARLGGQPNSATSQWFINLANNTSLDSPTAASRRSGAWSDTAWSVAQAIAALPRFDTLAYLQLPFNQIFRDLPVFSLPTDPPGGYGCSRAAPVFGLSVEPPTTRPPSSSTRRAAAARSCRSCSIRSARGAGATGPPDVPCTSGRSVYEINLPRSRCSAAPTR